MTRTGLKGRCFLELKSVLLEVGYIEKWPKFAYLEIESSAFKMRYAGLNVVPRVDLTEYNYNPTDIVSKSTQMVVHKKLRDDWKTEQENDPIIGPVIEIMRSKKHDISQMNDGSKRLLHNRSQLLFCAGLLYRKVFDGQLQENKFLFVLLKPYWKQALEACHDNMGHLGIERATSLLRDWFYWPSMQEDIEHHIKTCPRCLGFKTQPERLN